MLALSFVLGVLYVRWVAKRDGMRFERYLNMAYIMVIGGLVGARLSYVILHLEEFAGRWTAVFNPLQGPHFGIAGMNLYGGILLAIIGVFVYCRIVKTSVLESFDYFAPTLGIGLAFTRIGCFLNGCCFGTPCDLPWAVTFPPGSIPWYQFGDQPLHPAQLYSSLYGVLLFILLHFLLKRRRFTGQVVAVLFMVEAFFRFVIEYVRYYEEEMVFTLDGLQPTYNQVISVALFLLGLVIYFVGWRKETSR
jgi:phosphatidylglycerol:prolipoprotein diacylglycerol transferase